MTPCTLGGAGRSGCALRALRIGAAPVRPWALWRAVFHVFAGVQGPVGQRAIRLSGGSSGQKQGKPKSGIPRKVPMIPIPLGARYLQAAASASSVSVSRTEPWTRRSRPRVGFRRNCCFEGAEQPLPTFCCLSPSCASVAIFAQADLCCQGTSPTSWAGCFFQFLSCGFET